MKIGIIGLGFVGTAIKNAYGEQEVPMVLVDPAKGHNASFEDLLDTDAVFIAVPSPQGDDGSCDTSILETVLDKLKAVGYNNTIISKVTAPPTVYDALLQKYPNLVHAPEFLTADNASEDYINGTFAIIGGNDDYKEKAYYIIKVGQPNINNLVFCDIGEASLAKYTFYCGLATKVIFMIEMNDVCSTLGYDFDRLRLSITMDNRVGNSHTKVPGPDGQYGFGGFCFPKDTSALLKFAEDLKVDLSVLQSAVNKNNAIRKN